MRQRPLVWTRRLVRAVMAAALVVAMGFVLLSLVLSGESAQVLVLQWLSELLKAEVSYDTIRVSPVRGIDIHGVAVHGWPNDASSAYAKRLVIRPDWRELIGGRLRFHGVEADGWAVILKEGHVREEPRRSSPPHVQMVEIVEVMLRDGVVFLSAPRGVVRVFEVEGLVRLGENESSIRLRRVRGSIDDRLAVAGEASLWRLGNGPWDARISATTDAGAVSGTASSAEGGWTWDVMADSLDLAKVASVMGLGDARISGIAKLEASGQGLNARGRISIRRPGWAQWEAEEASASLDVAPGTIAARRFFLRRNRGQIRGTALLSAHDEAWTLDAKARADSLGIRLPDDPGGVVSVSGVFTVSGRIAPHSTDLRVTLAEAMARWQSWWVGGVEGQVRLTDDTVAIDRLVIGAGSIWGNARGWVSRESVDLDHDLWCNLAPTVGSFVPSRAAGVLHSRGRMVGPLDGVLWRGIMQLHRAVVGAAEVSSVVFSGEVIGSPDGWHAVGAVAADDLRVSGHRVLLAGRAHVEAGPAGIALRDAVVLRPGGVVLFVNGEWGKAQGRVTRLFALSHRWTVGMLGDASVLATSHGLLLPRLRVTWSAGGFAELRDVRLAEGSPVSGLALISHVPLEAVSAALALGGTYSGRLYAIVQASTTTHVWATATQLRRLPAMRDFPVDVELYLSREPSRFVIHSLTITQEALRVVGEGTIHAHGGLYARVHTEGSPLARVLVLADELLEAGLRPIFDARSGTLSATIEAKGTTDAPSFSGDIRVDGDAEIVAKPVRTTFRSVRGVGRLQGHSIIIDEVAGVSGRGHARIRGRLEMPSLLLDAASFDITGTLQEFRLIPGIWGIYDADVTLTKRGKGIGLEGEARLREGLINLPSIPLEPLPPTPASMDDQWFLTIVADRGVWVRDRFLNAEVAGKVTVTKEDGLVALQGDLELLRGTYLYLGRRFVLQRGKVSFLGGPLIMPELDVTATTVVHAEGKDASDVTLTLTVTGRADDPVLRVTADDERYNEEQIKTMLLFNLTPQDVVSLWQGDTFAREAAGAVEEFLAGELVRVLRDEAGLDELEVSPNLLSAEERDLYVRMGKYLTPELFVSVGKGLRSLGLDEIRAEYLLRALARRIGLGKNVDLKLVGERTHDEFSRTNYQVQMKLKYKF